MPLLENTLPTDSFQSFDVFCSYNLPLHFVFWFSDGIPPVIKMVTQHDRPFIGAPLLGKLPVGAAPPQGEIAPSLTGKLKRCVERSSRRCPTPPNNGKGETQSKGRTEVTLSTPSVQGN